MELKTLGLGGHVDGHIVTGRHLDGLLSDDGRILDATLQTGGAVHCSRIE